MKENSAGLTPEHLIDVTIKKMDIQATWLVLRGLKNNWITLVEHRFETPPKRTSVRKPKASEMEEEDTRGDRGKDKVNDNKNEEDEEDSDKDEED